MPLLRGAQVEASGRSLRHPRGAPAFSVDQRDEGAECKSK